MAAVVTIAAGGTIAAFSARRPTRFVMWLTAYLVLIGGLMQLGLAIGVQQLRIPIDWLVITAFLLYNLGNVAVIIGRALKARLSRARYIVSLGGVLLAASMLGLVWSVHHLSGSWTLAWFLILVTIILISMPIGLILSSRHRTEVEKRKT